MNIETPVCFAAAGLTLFRRVLQSRSKYRRRLMQPDHVSVCGSLTIATRRFPFTFVSLSPNGFSRLISKTLANMSNIRTPADPPPPVGAGGDITAVGVDGGSGAAETLIVKEPLADAPKESVAITVTSY